MIKPLFNRTLYVTLAKMAISILLLSFYLVKVDIAGVFDAVHQIRFITVVKTGLTIGVIYLVWSLKWKVLIPQIPFVTIVFMTMVAQYYSVILPGQISGEFIKIYRLGKGGENVGDLVASVIIDKFSSLFSILALAIIGLALSDYTLVGIWIVVAIVIIILSVLMLSAMLEPVYKFIYRYIERIPFPRSWHTRLQQQSKVYFNSWRMYLQKPHQIFTNLVLSMIAQLLNIVVVVVLSADLNIDVAFFDWFWIFGLMSIAVLIPVSLGGVGVRDVSLITLLALIGISADRSLALSFLIVLFIVAGATAGCILDVGSFLIMRKIDIHKR